MKCKNLARVGLTLLVLLAALAACVTVPPTAAPAGQMGVQALTGDLSGSIRIEDDLTVGGTAYLNGPVILEGATDDAYETTLAAADPTADQTQTFPDASGYVMLGAATGKYVIGVNTVTTTLTLTHGLTTPQAAFCTLIQDSEANGATCSTTINGGTGAVVLKLWKADGATAGSVGKQIAWMVTGQP